PRSFMRGSVPRRLRVARPRGGPLVHGRRPPPRARAPIDHAAARGWAREVARRARGGAGGARMKPRLLFHCHHTLGLGHLIRSLTLAQSFAECFDVVLLAGGELPENLELPRGLEIVPLTGLDERPARVLETFRRIRPEVVVVELFPFGRKKLAPELLPMLEAASASGARVVCSVRDILVPARTHQAQHAERP